MVNFSKYLGKEERVLNAIDMKDETIWLQNNVAVAEYKSWTTLVLTNKRLFSLSKRNLHMKEFRLEDIVSTGWIYRPQWGKLIWGSIELIAAAIVLITSGAAGNFLAQFAPYFGGYTAAQAAPTLTLGLIAVAALIFIIAAADFAAYLLMKRTTFTMTTKDGREYKFLLRGRRSQIDEFRMAVQDAKDLYLEESENRYFDKMRTVLFDQTNYEYALNNVRSADSVSAPEQERLKKEEYLIWERKNARLAGTPDRGQLSCGGQDRLPGETMRLNSDGTLQLEVGGGRQLKSPPALIEAPLEVKAADLFEQMGFEVAKLRGEDADFLLCKENLRAAAIVDKDEFGAITAEKIEKVITAVDYYKTDYGILISSGDMTDEIQDYADRGKVKIVGIRKAE
ncbi:MAG: restriction endonuclease [Methanosarcinales archaeon]|jgi:hypothetical protein|nr:restriction endonuclease [Methanosarcinales archaeon]